MMVIDTETYCLPKNNFHDKVYEKTQIVVGHNSRKDMRHFESWVHRRCGNYTQTSTFSIDTNGVIYQHYDPKYYSDYIGVEQDRCNISVTLVNPGWLKLMENNTYVDWLGHTYSKDKTKVIEKSWRGYRYWHGYTNTQITSLSQLLQHLCDIYKIEQKIMRTNVYDEDVDIFSGITFRSNYSKHYTDISPAFDTEKIKL